MRDRLVMHLGLIYCANKSIDAAGEGPPPTLLASSNKLLSAAFLN